MDCVEWVKAKEKWLILEIPKRKLCSAAWIAAIRLKQMTYHKINVDRIWIMLMKMGAQTGCHQRPERSIFIKGYQFPVCARCSGVLCGELMAILFGRKRSNVKIGSVLMGIMFLDWLIQYLDILESNNPRRFVTGIMGGYGAWSIYLIILREIQKVVGSR